MTFNHDDVLNLIRSADEVIPILRDYIDEVGPCDHSVGICMCGIVSATEMLSEAVAKMGAQEC